MQDNPDRKTKQVQEQRVRHTAEYNEGRGKGVQQSNRIRKEVNIHREGHHEYRTPLRYITGRKHPETTATRQNKKKRTRNYCTNSLISRWRCTLGWRRSARRQTLSSASAPLSTPRCHMRTFFAPVIQSRPSLTTTPNAAHFRPLPLRGTAPKASRFF